MVGIPRLLRSLLIRHSAGIPLTDGLEEFVNKSENQFIGIG